MVRERVKIGMQHHVAQGKASTSADTDSDWDAKKVRRNVKFDQFENPDNANWHVTLVRTPTVTASGSFPISSIAPSLALAYLSGALRRAGYSVTNIDAIGESIDGVGSVPRWPNLLYRGLSAEEIVERIPLSTALIGISTMFSSEWVYSKHTIRQIRAAFPDTRIIVGGEHASAIPELVLTECPEIDLVVIGEGEATLLEVVDRIKRGEELSGLAGIAYREKDEIIVRRDRSRIVNVDDINWPAWDLLPIENYLAHGLSHGPYRGKTMPITSSRGCPYRCTFCSNPTMWGPLWRARSASDVVDEILFYKKQYDISAIEFYDLTPIISKKWIIDFCNELINRKVDIEWQISGGTRTEALDETVIEKLSQAKCRYLGFAPESGSKEVLARINKQIDLDHMIKLFRIAKTKKGLSTRANFVIGFPEDTRLDIYKTLGLQMRLALLGVVDSPIFLFTPYPGSSLFKKLLEKKKISYSDQYFNSLGLDFSFKSGPQYCENVSRPELILYQTLGMFIFYFLYYLRHPDRAIRFIFSLKSGGRSNSVFEQRVIMNVRNFLSANLRKTKKQKSTTKRQLGDIRRI
jgi:anaerobic magnesium-protoporphyrin IX monomethyl ester cyclase